MLPLQVPVTRFDFKAMFMSLMNNPALMDDLALLDVNPNDPFGKYETMDGYVGPVNSGKWYQTAYRNLVVDTDRDFLCPICFACDETKLKGKGTTGCWPLIFSTTIFNTKLRHLPQAWRPLGYIYDMSILQSQSEQKKCQQYSNTKATTFYFPGHTSIFCFSSTKWRHQRC
jgi:hypothetical protein